MNSLLCGCSFIHPHRSLRDGLQLAKNLGFSRVDVGIGGGNAHFNILEVAQNPARFADEVRRESEALELEINECFALNFGEPINTPDDAIRAQTREYFEGLCDFAARAGFQSVMLIAGPTHENFGAEYSQQRAASALQELVKIADAKGLQLNLEADCDSCVNTPEAARDLCEAVPQLGLTLDHSHFICQGIEAARIEILYPFARHLHVRQSAPGRIVTPPDEGIVDFPDVFFKLKTAGYRGLVCIEYLTLTDDENAESESEARTIEIKKQCEAMM